MPALAPSRLACRDDPSGRELRRALLLPVPPKGRGDLAPVMLALASVLILLAGLLTVTTA